MVDDDVWKYFDGMPTAYVATVADGWPQVRPLTVMHVAGRLYILTGANSNKIKQLGSEPRFELVIPLSEGENNGYLRAMGKGEIVTDMSEKAAAAKASPYFDTYWTGHDDPDYALIRLRLDVIHLMRPGEMDETEIVV